MLCVPCEDGHVKASSECKRTDSKGIHEELCVCTCEICRPNGEDNRCNARNMTYASIIDLWMSWFVKNHYLSGIVEHIF